MSAARKTVLVAGLGPYITPAMMKQFTADPAAMRQRLDADLAAAAAAGFDCELISVNPGDVAWSVQALTEALRSKAWDGVSIGYGVRGAVENTALFERLVNAAVAAAPGIRFGFSPAPDGVYETVRRMFPEMKA